MQGRYSECVVVNVARDPDAPQLFQVFNHPQMQTDARVGKRAFVYVIDTSRQGMRKAHKFEQRMKIPHGGEKEAQEAGRVQFLGWILSANINIPCRLVGTSRRRLPIQQAQGLGSPGGEHRSQGGCTGCSQGICHGKV
jgi:hypothetical protein